MNTTITTEYNNKFIEIFTIESFNTVIQSFRKQANTVGLSAAEHILYNLVRNLPKKRGFTPITNKIKLANGQAVHGGYKLAKDYMQSHIKNDFKSLEAKFNLPMTSKDYLLELIDAQ